MKKKRIAALLLALLLLPCSTGALAAGAGSAQDPLISRSYATGKFIEYAVSKAQESIDFAMDYLVTWAAEKSGGNTGSFSRHAIAKGGAVILRLGGSITPLSGDARLSITSGQVINVTDGTIAQNGSILKLNNRYLAAESTNATATFITSGSVATDGGAEVKATGNAINFADVPSGYWAREYIATDRKSVV